MTRPGTIRTFLAIRERSWNRVLCRRSIQATISTARMYGACVANNGFEKKLVNELVEIQPSATSKKKILITLELGNPQLRSSSVTP